MSKTDIEIEIRKATELLRGIDDFHLSIRRISIPYPILIAEMLHKSVILYEIKDRLLREILSMEEKIRIPLDSLETYKKDI